MNPKALLISPQRADPLTWMLAVNLPVTTILLTAVGMVGIILATVGKGVPPWTIVVASALVALACALIARDTRPQRPNFTVRQGVIPFALSLVSVGVSAHGHVGSGVDIELWSGPLAVCVVLLALVPYSSAVALVGYAIVGGAVCAVVGALTFEVENPGMIAHLIAGGAFPFHTGVVGAAFCALAVTGVMRWQDLPYDDAERSETTAFTERVREFGTPVAVGDDVVALLERVAEEGWVTGKDRRRATELALGIRSDLVAVLNRSWLDAIAEQHSLTVVDEDRAAGRMTGAQRGAIHALISAVLESPMLSDDSLRIELRQQEDGTTAVALSMNISLPEGKRVMMIAPYVVSLKSAVDDLEWAGGEEFRMRFRLPAPEEHVRR